MMKVRGLLSNGLNGAGAEAADAAVDVAVATEVSSLVHHQ